MLFIIFNKISNIFTAFCSECETFSIKHFLLILYPTRIFRIQFTTTFKCPPEWNPVSFTLTACLCSQRYENSRSQRAGKFGTMLFC